MEIVDVVGISDTTSLVTWNPPKQRNGIITSYEVMYSVYENDTAIISVPLTSDINNFNITDLRKLFKDTNTYGYIKLIFILYTIIYAYE